MEMMDTNYIVMMIILNGFRLWKWCSLYF